MLNIALRAARSAGELIVRSMDRLDRMSISEKDAKDYVTDIDRAAEQTIINSILKAHPNHGFHAEESGIIVGTGEGADYQWIIDPLDGTTNYIHGIPHFAVSIACRYRGRIEHAVVYDPMRDEDFTASRGRGAMLNGRRLRVSKQQNLNHAVLATGFPFRNEQMAHIDNYLEMFKSLAGQSAGIRRAGAASLDLAYVAAGRFDGYFELGLKPWDIAAGELIVKEAGGTVVDARGGSDSMENGQVLACSMKMLKPLMQAVVPAWGEAAK